MTEFRDQHFHSLFDNGNALSISSIAFHNCEFMNCALSLTKDIGRRSEVSDILLKNCTIAASTIGPAVLRRVHVDGLKTGSLLIVWGAVFDQVKFSGVVGKIKINRYVHHVDRSDLVQSPFDEFRQSFYENSEWAIDIRDAKFRLLEISGIPAKLIRRDPASQMVVTRDRAMNLNWRSRISVGNKHWPFVIDMFLATADADKLLVAPLVGPKKQTEKLLKDLYELRDLGVVE